MIGAFDLILDAIGLQLVAAPLEILMMRRLLRRVKAIGFRNHQA